MSITPVEAATVSRMSDEIGEAVIRDLCSIPSGRLYARLSQYMSLCTYDTIIGDLTDRGRIKQDQSGMIHWIG